MLFNSLEKNRTFGGIVFDEIDRNVKFKLKKFNIEAEFDVVLQNSNTIAIIETKYKITLNDIKKLVEKKISDFRKIFPMLENYKIILGAGGLSFEEGAEKEAKLNGIGIIKIAGDNVEYFIDDIKVY